jgi:hypothetical protein
MTYLLSNLAKDIGMKKRSEKTVSRAKAQRPPSSKKKEFSLRSWRLGAIRSFVTMFGSMKFGV